MELLDWINDQLTVLAEAFGETLTEQRQEIYCRGLADIRQGQLEIAFRKACYELKWFPKLAELRELAGALVSGHDDGRPGPEEAWARMPKGDRMEDDSVVWCDEERIAYGACRGLLLDGDLIGARMAFKERYERELAEARCDEKPVRWSMSAGYDVSHRLATLAGAIQDKKMTLKTALELVPAGREQDFVLMLPSSEAKHLLTAAENRKTVELPGLSGVLAKMRMEKLLPEDLLSGVRAPRRQRASRSAEEWRRLRERAQEQVDFLKRSRYDANKRNE